MDVGPDLATIAAESLDRPSPPDHLSPSAAGTFAQCPRRWRFRYVDRLPDPPGLAAVAGTFVHRVLERLLGERSEQRTVDRARELAAEEWPAHVAHADVAELGLDEAGLRAHKWQVWRAITGLWDLEDPSSVQVQATEQRLEVDLDGIPFHGVIDRIDLGAEGMVVTDYKSGRPPTAAHTEERLDQVLLYAAAVTAAGQGRPARARLLYLGARTIDVAAHPEAVDAAVGRLRRRWVELRACCDRDEFPPRPGALCGWCPFVDRCGEGRMEVVRRAEAGWLPGDAPALRRVA